MAEQYYVKRPDGSFELVKQPEPSAVAGIGGAGVDFGNAIAGLGGVGPMAKHEAKPEPVPAKLAAAGIDGATYAKMTEKGLAGPAPVSKTATAAATVAAPATAPAKTAPDGAPLISSGPPVHDPARYSGFGAPDAAGESDYSAGWANATTGKMSSDQEPINYTKQPPDRYSGFEGKAPGWANATTGATSSQSEQKVANQWSPFASQPGAVYQPPPDTSNKFGNAADLKGYEYALARPAGSVVAPAYGFDQPPPKPAMPTPPWVAPAAQTQVTDPGFGSQPVELAPQMIFAKPKPAAPKAVPLGTQMASLEKQALAPYAGSGPKPSTLVKPYGGMVQDPGFTTTPFQEPTKVVPAKPAAPAPKVQPKKKDAQDKDMETLDGIEKKIAMRGKGK